MVFGVFDGLDEGHKHFLTEARKRCDNLFVVVTPDEVVGLLKHKSPLNSYEDRVWAIKKFMQNAWVVKGDSVPGTWEVIRTHVPEEVYLGHDQHRIGDELFKMGIPYHFITKL